MNFWHSVRIAYLGSGSRMADRVLQIAYRNNYSYVINRHTLVYFSDRISERRAVTHAILKFDSPDS